MSRVVWLLAAIVAASCSSPEPVALPLVDMPAIDVSRVLADLTKLASDEFGGRAPGSPGETLTVNYLTQQFKAAGLEPGNPDGSWVQKVPLVGITAASKTPLVVSRGGRREAFQNSSDVIAFSQRVTDAIAINDSEIVFVGYGVQAPEFQWDDFAGLDVRGKTLVVLVNDPPVRVEGSSSSALDPNVFGGNAMTYYGRWTYKYDKAAELGAAAVFIVHETEPAGYPFQVVQGFGGERFDLVTPDRNLSRAAIQGWLSLDAATRLMRLAGQDYQELKTRARTRGFTPVPLDMTASMSFSQTMKTLDSQNVVAKIPGSDPALRDEYVIYTAHWDHLGTDAAGNGDTIYNGARDNASGTAMLIEMARAFKTVEPAPRRTVVFLAVTAEEQGLLGAEYYARFPLYPLERTLAAINMDVINTWGRTKDMTIVGLGASDLDAYVRDAAAEQSRVLIPDSEPEKGFYYRSDHFAFAKAGVPALNPNPGVTFVDKTDAFGKEKRDEWIGRDYHQPSDEVKDWWDLSGAAEDGKILFAVGYRVANASSFPQWTPGNEFRAVRDRMLTK